MIKIITLLSGHPNPSPAFAANILNHRIPQPDQPGDGFNSTIQPWDTMAEAWLEATEPGQGGLPGYSTARSFQVEERNMAPDKLGAGTDVFDAMEMIKMVCLMKRRPGMSREQFIEHYETKHTRLAASLLPTIAGHQRNYTIPGTGLDLNSPIARPISPDFDVIMSLRFRSAQDYQSFLADASRPEIAALLAEDEERFLDRGSAVAVLVKEQLITP